MVGARTRVKIVKNKVAAPFKQTEFDIIYNEGISAEGELLALGEKFGLIEKSGASFSYKNNKGEKMPLGRGYDAARTFLRDKANKSVRESLFKEMKKIMESGALSFAGTPEEDEGEASKE